MPDSMFSTNRRAGEIDPQIVGSVGQSIRGGLEPYQEGGHKDQADPRQHQTDQEAQQHGRTRGPAQLFLLFPSVQLGNDHAGPAGQGGKEAYDQIGESGGAASYSGQSFRTHEPAHNNGIHRIIQLLKPGAGSDGQKEQNQFFPDGPLGQVPAGGNFRFHSLASIAGKVPFVNAVCKVFQGKNAFSFRLFLHGNLRFPLRRKFSRTAVFAGSALCFRLAAAPPLCIYSFGFAYSLSPKPGL